MDQHVYCIYCQLCNWSSAPELYDPFKPPNWHQLVSIATTSRVTTGGGLSEAALFSFGGPICHIPVHSPFLHLLFELALGFVIVNFDLCKNPYLAPRKRIRDAVSCTVYRGPLVRNRTRLKCFLINLNKRFSLASPCRAGWRSITAEASSSLTSLESGEMFINPN